MGSIASVEWLEPVFNRESIYGVTRYTVVSMVLLVQAVGWCEFAG